MGCEVNYCCEKEEGSAFEWKDSNMEHKQINERYETNEESLLEDDTTLSKSNIVRTTDSRQ